MLSDLTTTIFFDLFHRMSGSLKIIPAIPLIRPRGFKPSYYVISQTNANYKPLLSTLCFHVNFHFGCNKFFKKLQRCNLKNLIFGQLIFIKSGGKPEELDWILLILGQNSPRSTKFSLKKMFLFILMLKPLLEI